MTKRKELLGYELRVGNPAKPIDGAELQEIRDTVDPSEIQEEGWGAKHKCPKCRDCVDEGMVVGYGFVQMLLQHIDYLQQRVDEIDDRRVDWFGEE